MDSEKIQLSIGKSGKKDVSIDAQELVTGRTCVIGQSGSGKSYFISVLCEKLLQNNIAFCIVDTEGEYFCNAPETLLILSDGSIITIEEAYKSFANKQNIEILSLDTKTLSYKPIKIKAMSKQITNSSCILSIEGGRKITSTLNHRYLTLSKTGSLEWVTAENLNVGGYIAAPHSFSFKRTKDEIDLLSIFNDGFCRISKKLWNKMLKKRLVTPHIFSNRSIGSIVYTLLQNPKGCSAKELEGRKIVKGRLQLSKWLKKFKWLRYMSLGYHKGTYSLNRGGLYDLTLSIKDLMKVCSKEELKNNITLIAPRTFKTYETGIKPVWRINKDICYVLGLLLADGTIAKSGRRLAFTTNLSYLKKARKLIKKHFAIDGRLKIKQLTIFYDSKPLAKFFIDAFNLNKGRLGRRVPLVLCGLDDARKMEFLRGLFDGDGDKTLFRKEGVMSIANVSERFIQELSYLASSCGFKVRYRNQLHKSGFYDHPFNSYTLYFSKERHSKIPNTKDLIRNAVNLSGIKWKDFAKATGTTRFGINSKRTKVEKILQYFKRKRIKNVYLDRLEDILNLPIYWLKIKDKKILKKKQTVYGCLVPKTNNLICGNAPLISHNTLKQKFDVLWIGGPQADVNIENVDFQDLAKKSIENNVPLILDVSDCLDQRKVVGEFADKLYNVGSSVRQPYLLIIEEADKFVGQNKDSLKEIEEVSKRGRKRGLGLLVATQRPSIVNKNVLSQCGNQIIGKLATENDLKAVDLFFVDRKELELLPKLKVGEFFVMGNLAKEKVKIKGLERVTQHKGLTPKLIPKTTGKITELKTSLGSFENIQGNKSYLDKQDFGRGKIQGIKTQVAKEQAEKIIENKRKKKYGLFGEREHLTGLELLHAPVIYLEISAKRGLIKKSFKTFSAFLDGKSGEFVEIRNGFKTAGRGVSKMVDLDEKEVEILMEIKKSKRLTASELEIKSKLSESTVRKVLTKLQDRKIVTSSMEGRTKLYSLLADVGNPEIRGFVEKPKTESIDGNTEKSELTEDSLRKIVKGINPESDITKFEVFYYPIWQAVLGKRKIRIDGVTGKEI